MVTATPGEGEVRRSRFPLEVRCTKDGYLEASETFLAGRGDQGDTDTQRQQMTTSRVLVGTSYVGLSAVTVATMAPTLGGGATIAGAGLVAAPLVAALLVAMPVAAGVDYATGAAFAYPPTVAIVMVPAQFPDERARVEYFREIDRRLGLARETLRRDTEATCAKWNCDYLHKRDDDFIAERRAGAWPAHWFRDRLL